MREPTLLDSFGVTLDLAQGLVSGDRRDLMCGAACFS